MVTQCSVPVTAICALCREPADGCRDPACPCPRELLQLACGRRAHRQCFDANANAAAATPHCDACSQSLRALRENVDEDDSKTEFGEAPTVTADPVRAGPEGGGSAALRVGKASVVPRESTAGDQEPCRKCERKNEALAIAGGGIAGAAASVVTGAAFVTTTSWTTVYAVVPVLTTTTAVCVPLVGAFSLGGALAIKAGAYLWARARKESAQSGAKTERR